MATVSTVMAVAGSAKVLAPASRDRVMTLSSSSSFTCRSVPFVTNAPPPTASLKVIVASRASQDSEEQRPARREILVSLLSAAALLASTQAASAVPEPPTPLGEGAGTKVGDNSAVRNARGTPFGEGAGQFAGDNSDVRGASKTGTPLTEGSQAGRPKLKTPDASSIAQGATKAAQGATKAAQGAVGDAKSKINPGNPIEGAKGFFNMGK